MAMTIVSTTTDLTGRRIVKGEWQFGVEVPVNPGSATTSIEWMDYRVAQNISTSSTYAFSMGSTTEYQFPIRSNATTTYIFEVPDIVAHWARFRVTSIGADAAVWMSAQLRIGY